MNPLIFSDQRLFKRKLRFNKRRLKESLFDLLFDHVFNFRCLSSNHCEKIFPEKFELWGIFFQKMSERVSAPNERYVSTDETRVYIHEETNGQVKFHQKSALIHLNFI